LHKEHSEIFTRVNLLEKALIDLLQKRTAGGTERPPDIQKDFLEAFEHGITLHFTVEEEALFPALRKKGKNAETLVDELLLQHQSIMEKYSKIVQASHTDEERDSVGTGPGTSRARSERRDLCSADSHADEPRTAERD
jgi:iron-sulfur cluster repair protein YtfE (RIC family)